MHESIPAVASTLLHRALESVGLALPITLWDGRQERLGAGRLAPFRLRVASPRALDLLVSAPTLLDVGEAYAAGELEIDGDLLAAIDFAYRVDALTPTGEPVGEAEVSDLDAVGYHYDISNDFYALFLDKRMVYTCAYYRVPSDDLDTAQASKLDLVCHKLGLAAGERFVDLGCGWGGLLCWAAERYGVQAHGLTLSKAQIAWAGRVAAGSFAADQISLECRAWQDLPAACADKIAALGLLEHVGPRRYGAFFARAAAALADDGRMLVQVITQAPTTPSTSGIVFLRRHVFPGGGLASVATLASAMEGAGLRIVDVEALGGHYVRTTEDWLARLQAAAQRSEALVGEQIHRMWVLYLAAAAVAFRCGFIDVHQIVAEKARRTGPRTATTREHLYTSSVSVEESRGASGMLDRGGGGAAREAESVVSTT